MARRVASSNIMPPVESGLRESGKLVSELSSLVELGHEGMEIKPKQTMDSHGPNSISRDSHEKVVLWLKYAPEVIGDDSKQ